MKIKFGLFSLRSQLDKDKRISGPRLLARLLHDEEGAYLLYMTLTIPILLGLAALGTEGALLTYYHRQVQSAADAAAYSAAVSYSIDGDLNNATTQAQAIVANYSFVVGTGNNQANVVAAVDSITYSPLTAINVTVTRPQLPILSSIWVSNPFNVGGSAWAIISGGGGGGNGNCMLGLAPTGTDIALQGTPTIHAPNCGVFSNSTGDCSGNGSNFNPSINLGGHGTITAGSVGAAGCVSVTGSSSIGPPPFGYTGATTSCPTCTDNQVINPYAGTTTPAPGTCINDTVIKNSSGTTLNPGTYCSTKPNKNGALDIQNSIVTLNPGTYIFVGPGQINVDSQSTLTVNTALSPGVDPGVTLVFTDPSGTAYPHAQAGGNTPTAMNIQSGATLDLVAPTSGSTQGMLIVGGSNIPTDTAFNLQANAAGLGMQGVIYLPTADFTWGGGPIIAGGCTQMIAYRVIMGGNATFDNSNCDLSGGGGGGGAKPIGNVVTLVK